MSLITFDGTRKGRRIPVNSPKKKTIEHVDTTRIAELVRNISGDFSEYVLSFPEAQPANFLIKVIEQSLDGFYDKAIVQDTGGRCPRCEERLIVALHKDDCPVGKLLMIRRYLS